MLDANDDQPTARPADEMPLSSEMIEVRHIRVYGTRGGENERPAVVVCGKIEGTDRYIAIRLTSLDILAAFGRSLAEAGRRVFRLPNRNRR